MWVPRGGGVLTLSVGVRHLPTSAEGLRRAHSPRAVKGSHMHHSMHTESAPLTHAQRTHNVRTAYDCVTRALRHRKPSLLGSQVKEVCEKNRMSE